MSLHSIPPIETDILRFGSQCNDVRHQTLQTLIFRNPPDEMANNVYTPCRLTLGFNDFDDVKFEGVVFPSTCQSAGKSSIGQSVENVL